MPAKTLQDFALRMQEHRATQLQNFGISEDKNGGGGKYLTTAKVSQNGRCIFFHSHSRQ
jgi:hypothetical protein